MSELAARAADLFELAQSTALSNRSAPSEVHILVGPGGGVTIIMETGIEWSLGALQAYHGSESSYRISHRGGRVKVEGCSLEASCHFETVPASARWNQLTSGTPCYEVITGAEVI